MNLVILSRTPSLYSTRRLGLVGLARGHHVQVLDPFACAVVFRRGAAAVFVQGAPVGGVDAVISRTSPATAWHGLAVLRHFELAGAYCLNRSEPIARARDKLRTLQLLAQGGIPVVATALARRPADVRHAIEQLGGPPCVVKFSHGAQGTGVVLAESVAGIESVIEALVATRRNLLVQEFVDHQGDGRLLVVGRKVVAAIRRRPPPGEFRANLHRGGEAEALQPTDEEIEVALAATQALGLELAGVDLLRTSTGPLVLEVNASPGLEGVESASGRNVAGAILSFLEQRVRVAAEAPAP